MTPADPEEPHVSLFLSALLQLTS